MNEKNRAEDEMRLTENTIFLSTALADRGCSKIPRKNQLYMILMSFQ
jgi:hypothetical protein